MKAVPAEMTTLNISGKFYLNKALTDTVKMEEVLRLQGISWVTRKAIMSAGLTLMIKHNSNDDGIECIDIDQVLTGGIPGSREERILDWTEREREDRIFGSVIGKSKRVKVDDLDIAYLKEGWTSETFQHGLIQAYAESNTLKSGTTWSANQTWGFEEPDGEKRYTRHLSFTGPQQEVVEMKLFYDYLGTL